MPTILTSVIQSDFGGAHGNFEAVVLRGDELVHFWRDNADPALPWKQGQVIVPGPAAAAGSIIQSDFRRGEHGNLEVVVPLFADDGTMELWHFWHDSSDVDLPWQRGQRIATNVAGAGSIIQSDFRSGEHGNFEVVVPEFTADGSVNLQHFWHDNSDVHLPWRAGQRIAANVTGPGSIIQSDFRRGEHGNFEVTATLYADDGSVELWHFWHDNSDVNLPWQRGKRIAARVSGPGVLIQSDFRSWQRGNFEVVVPAGDALAHVWHDNSDVNLPWQRGQNLTEAARGWGCIIQSSFGSGAHRNFEVLAEEYTQSLIAYWHPNQDVNLPWMRGAVILGEPYPARVVGARKIVQLTGEYDREGWNGTGTPPFAFNRTESRFGIRGCDLGASFDHAGRLYFLFGDTWRVNQTSAQLDLDSVAFCTDTDAADGLHLTFLDQPPLLPGIDQGAFNVPLDGVSFGGAIYVFFSTDAYQIDGQVLMGRSVLGRSDDGANYHYLGQFSRAKFINVSVGTGIIDNKSVTTGFAVGTPVLWVFGSGRYRVSEVYLAVMPLEGLPALAPVRYFTGGGWSPNEADAAPLFCAGDVGELSVRWNPHLARWLALYNGSNPRGMLMHSAAHPEGPWSADPILIFDPGALVDAADACSGAGYGRFMHLPWNVRACDHVQDDMFSPQTFRDNEWGGEYGPYQITRFATALPDGGSRIWFVMSTWNPYQVMLMSADITAMMV